MDDELESNRVKEITLVRDGLHACNVVKSIAKVKRESHITEESVWWMYLRDSLLGIRSHVLLSKQYPRRSPGQINLAVYSICWI